MTSPAEDVLAVVAEFGADLQAAAKNAIDAIRETAATSQESYALAPPQPEQVNPWLKYAPIDPASLGLGAVVWARVGVIPQRRRFVAVTDRDVVRWQAIEGQVWATDDSLHDVEVLHPGIEVPS